MIESHRNRTRRSASIPRKLLREQAWHLLPVYYLMTLSDLGRKRRSTTLEAIASPITSTLRRFLRPNGSGPLNRCTVTGNASRMHAPPL